MVKSQYVSWIEIENTDAILLTQEVTQMERGQFCIYMSELKAVKKQRNS